VVFPHAEIKFYMTADAETRARRRWLELKEKGMEPLYENVLSELIERDKNDSSRELAPLTAAADAIHIDTTDLSVDQQVELMHKHISQYLEQA
jgi:cytidylate kinase